MKELYALLIIYHKTASWVLGMFFHFLGV